jgi:hypothetical protein
MRVGTHQQIPAHVATRGGGDDLHTDALLHRDTHHRRAGDGDVSGPCCHCLQAFGTTAIDSRLGANPFFANSFWRYAASVITVGK